MMGNVTIKDKIRKLLKLGTDNDNEAEIENALRFARRLMLQHNISPEELHEEKPSTDPHEVAADTEYDKVHAFTEGRNMSRWESTLSHAICRLIGTMHWCYRNHETKRTGADTIVYDKNGNAKIATRVTFYGPAEDVRDAAMMFDEWSQVIAAMARMKHGGVFRGPGRCYAEGFTQGLLTKVMNELREERQAIENGKATALTGGESCTALVLVNAHAVMAAKKERASDWLEEQGTLLRSVSRSGRCASFDAGAWAQGKADGNRVDFSRTQTKKLESASWVAEEVRATRSASARPERSGSPR